MPLHYARDGYTFRADAQTLAYRAPRDRLDLNRARSNQARWAKLPGMFWTRGPALDGTPVIY